LPIYFDGAFSIQKPRSKGKIKATIMIALFRLLWNTTITET